MHLLCYCTIILKLSLNYNQVAIKTIKRKAKRIADRPIKEKIIDGNIYAGSEEALLNKVTEVIVKIIKKEIGL
jgi:hypothetical protein